MPETALDIRPALTVARNNPETRETGVLERKSAIAASMLSENAPGAAELDSKQKKERKEVDDRYSAMREVVKRLHEIQDELYKKLSILPKTEDNTGMGKFKKGIVDALVTENVEFLKIVAEQGIEAVVKALASMLSSVESVKKFMGSALDGLKSKVEGLLDFDAYSAGKALGGVGFGALGLVRSGVREGVALGVKEALQSAAHLTTFKIPLGFPPVLTGTRIFECAELVNRELVLKWPEEVTKVLNLLQSTGEYLGKHGHEAKALSTYERRHFESAISTLVSNTTRLVNDPNVPQFDRMAIDKALKAHVIPAFQADHKMAHHVK